MVMIKVFMLEAEVQSHFSPCGIYGEQIGIAASFSSFGRVRACVWSVAMLEVCNRPVQPAGYHIDSIMPEGRINRVTDLQDTEFLHLLGLTYAHY
jgi:hypothetical protein